MDKVVFCYLSLKITEGLAHTLYIDCILGDSFKFCKSLCYFH